MFVSSGMFDVATVKKFKKLIFFSLYSLSCFPLFFPSPCLAGLAVGLPDLGDLITLVGALASSCLVFVFPPIINILTFSKPPSSKKSSLRRSISIFKDICIIAVGLVGCVLGTYAAISNLIGYFENGQEDFTC